jgi:hypothetical protein
MKRKTLFAVLFLLGAAPWAYAAQNVLPSSFGGWTASAPVAQISGPALGSVALDQTGIFREYGVSSAEKADYAQNDQTATVMLYKMTDPSAAFGIFTFLRSQKTENLDPISPPGDAVAYAAGSKSREILVIGNFLLDVSSAGELPPSPDLKALADALSRQSDKRPFPPIAGFLPKAGLVKGSEVYVLGPQALAQVFPIGGTQGRPDWIGFDKSAEAILARYHVAGQPKENDATLVLAMYPNQQIAANEYDRLAKFVSLNASAPPTNGRTAAFGTRSSALIALLSGVESREVASGFLGQIHYASDVTWNESSHDLTDPSISAIVIGAIVDSGSIMMLALAAGIGFGGLRLFMKLVLPGRVFDRHDNVEILQLGLTSKPVNSKDFY